MLKIPTKLSKQSVDQIKQLYSSKRKKDKSVDEELGLYRFERTYKTKEVEFYLNIFLSPSKSEFSRKLDAFTKEIKVEAKSQLEGLVKKTDIFFPDQEGLFFSLRCGGTRAERLSLKMLRKMPKKIESLFDVLIEISPKHLTTRFCLDYHYDIQKFKFVGGFTLPAKIPISGKVVKRLGVADISGLHLSFKESPLGIQRISVRQDSALINVFAEFSSKIPTIKNVLQEVFRYGAQALSLFLEAKE